MDVLLDTNAVRGAGLDGPAFRSLRDYLTRTDSALLVPSVVLEELLALKERNVRDVQRDLDGAFRAMKALDPNNSDVVPHLGVAAIVATERARMLAAADRVMLLDNNAEEDLPELVRRLAHRIPPASPKGEEARDVLIWLAARRRLAVAPLALITADAGFVAGSTLRPELLTELGTESARLQTFRSLDDFLAQHHRRVSWITEAWVSSKLGTEIVHEAVVGAIDDNQELFDHLIEELGEPSGYLTLTQIIEHKILKLVVSDLPGSELYVGATVWAELEIEVEFYADAEDDDEPLRTATKCIYPCVEYHIQMEVAGQDVVYALVTRVKQG